MLGKPFFPVIYAYSVPPTCVAWRVRSAIGMVQSESDCSVVRMIEAWNHNAFSQHAVFRKPLYRVEYTDEIESWLDKFENVKGPLTMMQTSEFTGKSISEIAKVVKHSPSENFDRLLNVTWKLMDVSM